MHAAGGRDVGVIAAFGNADVALAGKQIVRGIEFHPADIAEIRFNPRMCGSCGGAIM